MTSCIWGRGVELLEAFLLEKKLSGKLIIELVVPRNWQSGALWNSIRTRGNVIVGWEWEEAGIFSGFREIDKLIRSDRDFRKNYFYVVFDFCKKSEILEL